MIFGTGLVAGIVQERFVSSTKIANATVVNAQIVHIIPEWSAAASAGAAII
jgi:hypothetical protein